MNSIHWQNLGALMWLWLLPLLAGLFVWAAWRRRQALACWAGPAASPVSPVRRFWKAAMILLALALLLLALGRPGWIKERREVERRGRDTVFVLDVSRSMLAEDLAPNRLERAKLMIRDALESLEGNRVGLVLFAGSASVKCPLTTDHGFLRTILDDASWDSVERGGSNLGDALRKTLDSAFDSGNVRYRDLILITDGEDQESFPVEAARKLGEAGVRLVIVGIGNPAGSRIPVQDKSGGRRFLTYKDGEVRTKLEAATLREMASVAAGARYYHVGTDTIDLGAICSQMAKGAESAEFKDQALERYREEFQGLLFLAFLLLLLEAMFGDRLRIPAPACPSGGSRLAVLLLIGWLAVPVQAGETAPAEKLAGAARLVQQGNVLYGQGKYAEAAELYQKAAEAAPAAPEPRFNRGLALARQKEFEKSAGSFNEAAVAAAGDLRSRSEVNAARSRLDQAGAMAKTAPQDGKTLKKALDLAERSSEDFDSLRKDNRVPGETAPLRELAHAQAAELRRQLEELKKQQQQQQDQQKQQLKEQLEKQQQLRQDNEKNQQKQDQQQQRQEARKQADQQQQLQKETEKLKQEQQQSQSAEAKPQSGQEQKPQAGQEQKQDPLDQASRQQQQAANDLKQDKLKEAEAHQKQAEEQLREALRQMEEKEKKDKDGEKSEKPENGEKKEGEKPEKPQPKPDEATPPEKDQAQEAGEKEDGLSPDDFLKYEQQVRQWRNQRRDKAHKPVEKDW